MQKTADEINAEIAALKALRPKIVPRSVFGEYNIAALDAVVEALTDEMEEEDANDNLDSEHWTEGEADAARYAINWREGDEEEAYSAGLPLKK